MTEQNIIDGDGNSEAAAGTVRATDEPQALGVAGPQPSASGDSRLVTAVPRGRRSRAKAATLALGLDDARAASGEPRSVDELAADLNPPNESGVARAVHARLARSRDWQKVSLEEVQAALRGMALDLSLPEYTTPRLLVTRLRFTGTKRRTGNDPEPVAYDQAFAPGVNVVHVSKNMCGKSTIFQLIRFALTGDQGGIAADVRPWISQLWLHFMLGDAKFTIHLDQPSGALRGYLAAGHVASTLSDLESSALVIASFKDAEQTAARLQDFFFERLHLASLGWTDTRDGTTSDRFISWRTYWQALAVPDSSEEYLMVDSESSKGNQQGLLLSMLLGLRFAEPINNLLLEQRKLESKVDSTTEERRVAIAARDDLAGSATALEAELDQLSAEHLARRVAFDEGSNIHELQETLLRHDRRLEELRDLARRRDELTLAVQRERASARSLRETADLRLHFTGLAVSLCPNCDEDVTTEAIAREQESHDCRLCGKTARSADGQEVDALRAEADAKETHATVLSGQRDELTQMVRETDEAVKRESSRVDVIRERIRVGMHAVLPTPAELAARDDALLRLGAVRSALAQASAAVDRLERASDSAPFRALVMVRARKILREVAERLNATLLADLNRLIQGSVAALGADSITAVHCSAVGTLTLQKHGAKMTFGSVKAPGERLRIKLAFYLAMMRLGRIAGHGRHPGFLMIDQPGSDEMIDLNFATLAAMLREINTQFTAETQIICFTARPQLAAATVPEKVYGTQAGEWMF